MVGLYCVVYRCQRLFKAYSPRPLGEGQGVRAGASRQAVVGQQAPGFSNSLAPHSPLSTLHSPVHIAMLPAPGVVFKGSSWATSERREAMLLYFGVP